MPLTEPELRVLHRWHDCWHGVGDVITGMKRQGYEVSIGDHGGKWTAVFVVLVDLVISLCSMRKVFSLDPGAVARIVCSIARTAISSAEPLS